MKVVNGKEFRDNIVAKLKEQFKDLSENQNQHPFYVNLLLQSKIII